MRSDVDRFCPLPISGLTVFLRSRATADTLWVSDPIKAAFGRVAPLQSKVEAQRFFTLASFIISAFVRVRKRSPPTTSCICWSLPESGLLRFAARAAFFPPLQSRRRP